MENKFIHLKSSYKENNFGPVFRNTIITFIPHVVVELGVLNGYSTAWIAMGLDFNYLIRNHRGHLHAYDLWDDYAFSHGNKEKVEILLTEMNLMGYVSLCKSDAFEVYKTYGNRSVDILHVDLSNTGDIFDKIVKQWHPLLSMSGILLFEGGSEERDQVDWMIKYQKSSIRKAIAENKIINKFYQYGTYNKFPSLTVLIKKGE